MTIHSGRTNTYAALKLNSNSTCTLLVLHEGDCQPEERTFTSVGWTHGGAGHWLNQHEPYAQVIPIASLMGLVRYRAELCTGEEDARTAEVSEGASRREKK